ncbi:SDR family oxidoreductase [Rothia dentocariosa]|jgi:short-chain dehydrogenase/reductase SDR|uniref:SDR family oxidoreductase n=1 Tax=Rothia dentocariosa TaxID=2047 RepID=UPI0024306B9C|nr:SDR family oxidoreductase [Rothia dentocariosa]
MDYKNTASPVGIVTGASSGIGEATCNALLDRGYEVVGISRRGNDVLRRHEGYHDITCDARIKDEVRTELRQLGNVVRRTKVVVLNAGVSPEATPLTEIEWDTVESTFQSNVRTALTIIQETVPFLRISGGGSLTFVGASIANGYSPDRWAYAASKSSMTTLMRSCSIEFSSDHIIANEVRPGPVATPMTLGMSSEQLNEHTLAVINEGYKTDWLKLPTVVADWIVSIAEFPANGPTGQVFNFSRKTL